MEEEVDLTGVDPSRRAEIRRRVDVLQRYAALPAPTHEDDLRHADELGTGVPHFLLMARAWREHRRPAALPRAKAPRRRRPKASRSEDATATRVDDAIEILGRDANAAAVHRAVVEASSEAGVPVPSLAYVRSRLLRSRAEAPPGRPGGRSALLDHVAVALPVDAGSGPASLPVLSFVAAADTGRILGHSISTNAPSPQAAARALAAALARSTHGDPWFLGMAVDATPGWRRLLDLLQAHSVERSGRSAAPLPCGRVARRLFGERIGGIQFRTALVHRPRGAAAGRTGRRPVLTFREAVDEIGAAVVAHNAARPDQAFGLARLDAEGLLAALRLMGAEPPEPARFRSSRRDPTPPPA